MLLLWLFGLSIALIVVSSKYADLSVVALASRLDGVERHHSDRCEGVGGVTVVVVLGQVVVVVEEVDQSLPASRHSDALRKIGEVADSHRDTLRELGQTSGRVEELQVRSLANTNHFLEYITTMLKCIHQTHPRFFLAFRAFSALMLSCGYS